MGYWEVIPTQWDCLERSYRTRTTPKHPSRCVIIFSRVDNVLTCCRSLLWTVEHTHRPYYCIPTSLLLKGRHYWPIMTPNSMKPTGVRSKLHMSHQRLMTLRTCCSYLIYLTSNRLCRKIGKYGVGFRSVFHVRRCLGHRHSTNILLTDH